VFLCAAACVELMYSGLAAEGPDLFGESTTTSRPEAQQSDRGQPISVRSHPTKWSARLASWRATQKLGFCRNIVACRRYLNCWFKPRGRIGFSARSVWNLVTCDGILAWYTSQPFLPARFRHGDAVGNGIMLTSS